MSDLLLINLGMGSKNTKAFGPLGYAETDYLFDDGSSYATHLAGLALWKWLSKHQMAPSSVCFAATPEVWGEKEDLVREEAETVGLDWARVAEPVILSLPRAIEDIWAGLTPLEKWIEAHSIPWEDVPTLHVDLTHAYRAIPIVHTWMALYFQRLGNVKIGFMGYGAYVPDALGPTPMIDLSPVMQLAEWAAAARDFEKRGDAGALSELLEDDGKRVRSRIYSGEPNVEETRALKVLGSISSAAGAIGRYLPAGLPVELGIKARRALGTTRSEDVGKAIRGILPPAAPIASKIFDVASRIAWQGDMPPAKSTKKRLVLSREEIDRETRLVEIWADRGATGAALRALRELMVTRVLLARSVGAGWLNQDQREPAAKALNELRPFTDAFPSLDERHQRLGEVWHAVCEDRNVFAHAGMKGDEIRVESIANRLAKYIERFKAIDGEGDGLWQLR